MAGQFAKLEGCYVSGIAGGLEKCLHLLEDLKFDQPFSNRYPSRDY